MPRKSKQKISDNNLASSHTKPVTASLFDDDGENNADINQQEFTNGRNVVNSTSFFEQNPGTSSNTNNDRLHINRKFAERYEEKKRKQELARARELGIYMGNDGDGNDELDDDEEEEPDDTGELLTDVVDRKILDTIELIRKKDPRIYNPGVKFFAPTDVESSTKSETVDEQDGNEATTENTRAQPKKIKKGSKASAVIAAQLIEAAERGETDAFVDDEEDHNGDEGDWDRNRSRRLDMGDRNPKVYDAEQAALRKAFLDSAADDENLRHKETDVSKTKRRDVFPSEKPHADAEPDSLLSIKQRKDKGNAKSSEANALVSRDQLQQYLRDRSGKGRAEHADELADPEGFLAAFSRSSAWRDAEMEEDEDDMNNDFDVEGVEAAIPAIHHIPTASIEPLSNPGDSEDEAALEAADEFEAKYNFRFEEPGGTTLVSYGRGAVEGSLRRKDTSRKEARERRVDRQAAMRAEAEAETRRLMNLRRAELKSQMARIRGIAGNGVNMDRLASVFGNDLDGDFDPEKHDAQMAALFGDDYYAEPEEEAVPIASNPDTTTTTNRSRTTLKNDSKDVTNKGSKKTNDQLPNTNDVDNREDTTANDAHEKEEEEDEDDEISGVPSWVFGDGPRPAWAGPSAAELAAAEGDDAMDAMLGLSSSHSASAAADDISQHNAQEAVGDRSDDAAVTGMRRAGKSRRANKAERKRISALARARALAADDPALLRALGTSDDGAEALTADPDEVLALGFEDVIAGGLKTRFKYTQVPPADYGLSAEEILLADDADLARYVSLRKLAPYRETEWVVPGRVRRRAVTELRKKLKEELTPLGLVRTDAEEDENAVEEEKETKPKKKKRIVVENSNGEEETEHVAANDDEENTQVDAESEFVEETAPATVPTGSKPTKKSRKRHGRTEKTRTAADSDAVITLPNGAVIKKRRLAMYEKS